MKEVLNSNADKITKTLVVSGCLYSNYQSVYDILVKAGLAEAPLSKNSDMLLPVELQQNIFKNELILDRVTPKNLVLYPPQSPDLKSESKFLEEWLRYVGLEEEQQRLTFYIKI